MSWGDIFKGGLGNVLQQAEGSILQTALAGEGLNTVLGKLQEAGLGEHVRSWLDQNRDNLPISADQIKAALGEQHLQQLASSLGIPVDAIAAALAQHLPTAVSSTSEGGSPDESPQQQ